MAVQDGHDLMLVNFQHSSGIESVSCADEDCGVACEQVAADGSLPDGVAQQRQIRSPWWVQVETRPGEVDDHRAAVRECPAQCVELDQRSCRVTGETTDMSHLYC